MWSLCNALLASSFLAAPNPAPIDDSCVAQMRQAAAPAPAALPPRLQSPAEVVDALQRSYEGVRDYTASFTQELTNTTAGETTRSQGTLYFKKPGKMRWDYRTPEAKALISDGKTLWIWEPAFKQYAAQPVAQSSAPLALRFLMGEGKLSDDFTAEVKAVKEGSVALELTPKSAASGVDKLRFVITTADWKVQEAVLYDPLGNRNRLVFTGARWNTNLPDSGFVFAPPAGAREIKAPGR